MMWISHEFPKVKSLKWPVHSDALNKIISINFLKHSGKYVQPAVKLIKYLFCHTVYFGDSKGFFKYLGNIYLYCTNTLLIMAKTCVLHKTESQYLCNI